MTLRFGRHIRIDGRNGPPTIQNWSAEEYEQRVRRLLWYVFSSHVGRGLHGLIRRRLEIAPYTVDDDDDGQVDVNATTQGLSARRAAPRGRELRDAAGRAWRGRGTGSRVRIEITPSALHRANERGFSADDVLVHELAHAVRMMAGLFDVRPMGDGWDTIEEFHAILVTNVYRSERGKPMLRHGHQFPLETLPNPTAFYGRDGNFVNIGVLWREMPSLCQHLSRTPLRPPTTFNPFLEARGSVGAYARR